MSVVSGDDQLERDTLLSSRCKASDFQTERGDDAEGKKQSETQTATRFVGERI